MFYKLIVMNDATFALLSSYFHQNNQKYGEAFKFLKYITAHYTSCGG